MNRQNVIQKLKKDIEAWVAIIASTGV